MARPRRSTSEAFYDVFADFDLTDQVEALRILTELHRQKQREARRRPAAAEVAGPTALFLGDKRINGLADLDEPGRNAALDLEDGTKQ
jgi:hypothetical protein